MIRPQFVSRLVLWSSALAMVLAGCGASGSVDQPGTGGQSASGGASASGGKTGSGGSTSSGGTTGSGGVTSSGGVTGTGGSVQGSGGQASGGTTGAGGHVSGTGGAATASGGAAGGRMGQAGSGGGAGHAASGGTAGSSSTGSGGSGTGAGGTSGGGGGSGTPGMSAGCGTTPTIASSMYNNGTHIPFTSGTQQRRYILNVPTNYDKSHPYKLIITYHELNGNDTEMYNQKFYNLLPQSNNTAIFIAPNGSQSSGPCTGNSSGDSGCGWPNSGSADLNFVDALVKEIEKNFCIDTNRIFADGWSYGGSMSYKTACERPLGNANGYIRGVAVYSGSQLSGNCTPTKPVAYYASHGTHDSVLNYSNGVGLAQNFAKANGCTWATPTSVTSGAHVCTNEMGCMAGYPLEFCSFNGDHTPFPDNGQESGSWNAANVWTFFNQF
jgi:poly(3-hydroxybutyrate) depolymerase